MWIHDSFGASEGVYGEASTLTHVSGGLPAQPLHKARWCCIKSLKTFVSVHPIIALLGIYHKKIQGAHQNVTYNTEKLKA